MIGMDMTVHSQDKLEIEFIDQADILFCILQYRIDKQGLTTAALGQQVSEGGRFMIE
jgi:hypothetical protein